MDITTITDPKEIKALCFDEIQRIEVSQNNLRMLQTRLAELQGQEDVPPVKKEK